MSDELWFDYHGERLEPFHHLYNLTFFNERAIELAVAHRLLDSIESPWVRDSGLEVGNVLGHYRQLRHCVWDLHEEPAWYQDRELVKSHDILEVPSWGSNPRFPWVISLSTIEHTANPIQALEILYSLVEPGGWLLVSFPTGVDNRLDCFAEELPDMPGITRACTIVRDGNDHGGWVQTPKPQLREYGPWANSVVIMEYSK